VGLLKKEISREFIAVPDDRKAQIVFKWPDVNIRRFSKAIVEADQIAVFMNTGQVIGVMPPGRHDVDANELPFLGTIIDHFTDGNAYRAELYFVGTREYVGNTFGGRVDNVQDPQTGMLVTLRVFGDYSLRVVDPIALLTNLTGTVDVANNEAITLWVADQLLKVMRTDITRQIVRNGWPILGLSAYTPDIEQSVVQAGNVQLETYGLALVKMGNFDINLAEEDEANLKGFSKDTAYSRLAGGFQQYAAGEALLGAGEGLAKGGGAAGNAFLGVGMGLGQQMGQPPQPGPTPPPAPGFPGGGQGYGPPGGGAAPGVACPSCQAMNAAGAKFCASCGTSLAPPTAACPSCGAENAQGAKFCSSCGASMAPAVQHCSNCGEELAAGAKFCASCGTQTGAAPAAAAPAGE
jgi:membrane protease subunit (stomatin/prohibitin family)